MLTNCPSSQSAPIRTRNPPATIDGRSDWPWPRLSSMSQPYPAGGRCQGPPPDLRPHGRGGTEVVHDTLRASRRPRDADPAPVQNQPQAEPGPFRRRDQLGDVGFDLDRIRALGQTQAPREPLDVRVDREARNPERDPQHNIGGLAADPRQRDEVLD